MPAKGDECLSDQNIEHYNMTHGNNPQYAQHIIDQQHGVPPGAYRHMQQHMSETTPYRGQSSMLLSTTQFPSKSPNIQQTMAMSPKPSPSPVGNIGVAGSSVGVGLQPAMMQAPVYASTAPVMPHAISPAAQPQPPASHLSRSHVLRENEPSPLLSANYDCLSDDDDS